VRQPQKAPPPSGADACKPSAWPNKGKVCDNQLLSGALLDKHCALSSEASSYLHQVAAHFGWSGRGTHRVLKVARTIADLSGMAEIETSHLAEAVQYRRSIEAD